MLMLVISCTKVPRGSGLHSFQEAETCHQQRTQANGLKNSGPFSLRLVMMVSICDLEAGPCKSNNAEDCEVDPAELFLKAMTQDNDESEDKDGYVDANLGNSNCFLSR